MTVLNPLQLIFTRVEPKYSPTHYGGFQIYYHSPGISKDQADEISKHVQCFITKDLSITRLQYFAIGNESVVVAHSKMLLGNPEIVDSNRRGGAFLAHCLIFNKRDFEKAGNNPFLVFDTYTFLEDPEEMVENYNLSQGKEVPAVLDVRPTHGMRFPGWNKENAIKLAMLAADAANRVAKRQSILLIGGQDEIADVLRMTFALTPSPELRRACTFDTYIDRCSVMPEWYWAVGAPNQQQGDHTIIQAVNGQIRDAANVMFAAQDEYTTWLNQALKSDYYDLPRIIEHSQTIYELRKAFRAQSHPDYTVLNEEASNVYFNLNQKRIERDFQSALEKTMSAGLVQILWLWLVKQMELPQVLGSASSQQVNLEALTTFVRRWMLDNPQQVYELKKPDRKALVDLGRRNHNPVIMHWAATLQDRTDKRVRDEALGMMSAAEFEEALQMPLEYIAPSQFVSRKHLKSIANLIQPEMATTAFLDFVDAVLEHHGEQILDIYVSQITTLSNEELQHIEKRTAKKPNLPFNFQQALQRRRGELGAPPSLLDKLF